MRVVVLPASGEATEKFIAEGDAAQLKELQEIVGGYITPFIMPKFPKCLLLAREFDHPAEEAHAPLNQRAEALTGFALHGDCVVVGQAAPEFMDVPSELIKEIVG